jgi:hypothetical protein
MRMEDVPNPPTWVRMIKLDDGVTVDPVTKLEKGLKNTTTPELEEPALTHPFTSSTVKLRNNGMIDIFVQGDQGIRVDPITRTVNIIADGLKEHLNYYRAFIMEDAQWWAKKALYFKSEESTFKIDSYSDMTFTITGPPADMSFKSTRDINFSADRDLNMNIKGDVRINASGKIFLTGKEIHENG